MFFYNLVAMNQEESNYDEDHTTHAAVGSVRKGRRI